MCDVQGKKSEVYKAAVARLRSIFNIRGPRFEQALLGVVRKHCQGAPTKRAKPAKKGTRACYKEYKNLSKMPHYKEVFGGIVHVFGIRNPRLFYADVRDVIVAYCRL